MEINKNYNGKTQLKDWWGIVKGNFDAVETEMNSMSNRIRNNALNITSLEIAVSDIEAGMGKMGTLQTNEKDSLVGAINELYNMIVSAQEGGE